MNKSEVKGLFLFSSCFSLGLDFVITIRNAPSEDRGPLEFQLNLFLDGNLVYSKDYPPLEYKGFFEIDSNEIEHNLDASKDYLVTIVSNRPQNNKDLI